MEQIVIGALGIAGMLGVWLWQNKRLQLFIRQNKALEVMLKLQRGEIEGLKEASKYAVEQLKERNKALAENNPAGALDVFFSGVRKD